MIRTFKYRYSLLFAGLCLLAAPGVHAQQKLDSLEFVHVGEYQPTISDAYKINDNPAVDDSSYPIPVLKYAVMDKKRETNFHLRPIKPARMLGEPLTKLYPALVKLGMGTYTTPYGEVFYNNLRSRKYSYGAHLRHLSSTGKLKDVGYSAYSNNLADIYGTAFLYKETLSGNIKYNRNVVHDYGYDILNNDLKNNATKERYMLIGGHGELQSHFKDSAKINHDIKLAYYNLSDIFKAKENHVKAAGNFSGFLDQELINVNAAVNYYNNRNRLDTVNNTIVHIAPGISASGDKWKAGIGLAADVDVWGNNSKFHFYPDIDFNYNVFENIIVPYAGVKGALHKNSYKSLSDANPFIMDTVQLHNSSEQFDAYAGVRGSLSKNMNYDVRFSASKVNDMPLFVNDTSEILQNRFAVIYDNARIVNLHGELEYQQSEKLDLYFKLDYNDYSMAVEKEAWHLPQYRFAFDGNYNIKNKIVVKSEIYVIGKQYAKTYTYDTNGLQVVSKSLNGMADFNLGLEYRYSKILSAFINFNNIGAVRYYRWDKYPTQRFNLMGGVTYAF